MSALIDEHDRQRIHRDFGTFEALVTEAEHYFARGRYDAAAVQGQIAATHAHWKHPGLFVSPRLERLLVSIGQRTVHNAASSKRRRPTGGTPQRVLHVTTRVFPVGGHSRMLWRWIQQDAGRSHSVAITRQGALAIPEPLRQAVRDRGGQIHLLNANIGNVLSWARTLRALGAQADVIVMHLFCDDVIPLIAFADRQALPPTVFVDHIDHLFWLGGSVSDVVANLRESGQQLAQERRGVEPGRCSMVPIVLSPLDRTLSRAEAKARLGLPADAILLLSIARRPKYTQLDGSAYPEMFVPVLLEHPRAHFYVVGPDHEAEWVQASLATQGRVQAFGERSDTATFYAAADIYVDSFPVPSITSLLEAASLGVPLVSRCEYSPGILCADTPALSSDLIHARGLDEFRATLARLIEDEELRARLGETIRQRVIDVHTGSGWQLGVEKLYAQAVASTPVVPDAAAQDEESVEDVDAYISLFFRNEVDVNDVIQVHLKGFPLDLRLRLWSSLVRTTGRARPNLLLPEWATGYGRRALERLQQFRRRRRHTS